MEIRVSIDPRQSTAHEFARVTVAAAGGATSILDIDYTTLRDWGAGAGPALELLYVASTVYGIDKLVDRHSATDNWTRDLRVKLPVPTPDRWTPVASDLAACLGFLTGDRWQFSFSKLSSALARPSRTAARVFLSRPTSDAVCLFSGGLDSFVGAVDWLELQLGKSLALVGHHDPRVPGPLGDQERLLEALGPEYPNRTRALLVRVGQEPPGVESTLRSRSFLFIGLGVYAASNLGNVPLLMPENGTIALNAPLTPSRRGSCSTRTAHPYYLEGLRSILLQLGLPVPVSNPLLVKTKGEAVSQCLNQSLLRRAAALSTSCAKRGHKRTWVNKSAQNCGRCMPCIYRRAALHSSGLDTEEYGIDVCAGEMDIDDAEHDVPNDFRACLSFLRQNLGRDEMASLLLASGRLRLNELPAYSEVVVRATDEMRNLLRDKATNDIKLRAGLR
jgi:hypothetical protein